MKSQTPMVGMPDLHAEGRKRLVLIVEDEFVNRTSIAVDGGIIG